MTTGLANRSMQKNGLSDYQLGRVRQSGMSNRTKLLLLLLLVGLIGAFIMAVLMMLPSVGQVLTSPDMDRVSGIADNVLSILALPALIFFLVLVAFAISELVKIYRLQTNPKKHRKTSGKPLR